MKTCKQVSKRVLAVLLSLLILATNIGVLPIVAAESDPHNHGSEPHSHGTEPQDNVWSGTTGSLVAGNYELNKYEQAILACTGLIGDTYSVEVPNSTTEGLVSVNADAQTVTAKPYEVNGFVWVPSSAVLKYTAADGNPGADISVALSKKGDEYVGTFNKPANSYRVEVTYSLYIAVDSALQQSLLSAPYYLVDGYDKVSAAVDGSLALVSSTMNEKMEQLRQLSAGSKVDIEYDGSVVYTFNTPALADGAVKTALNDLLDDYDKNGGTLTLAKYCSDYQRAASKLQFVIEQGAAFKEHIAWFYERVDAIGSNAGRAELTAFVDSLPGAVSNATEEAVQVVIDKAVKKASDLGLDWSSLKGKTRKNNAIYNELDAKRAEIESLAKKADDMADFYEMMAGNSGMYAEQIKQYRDQAAEVRSTGFEAVDALESAIRAVYTEGDAAVAEAEAKAAEAKTVIDYLPSVVSAVRTINRQKWDFTTKTLVKDSITADEYKALDKAVIAAYDSGEEMDKHDDVEILNKLFATSTVINAMVDQYSIYVNVKANVIAKNSVDSASTVALQVFNTDFPMDKNTSAADILAAIEATGIENSALAQWDSYYNVGDTFYNRTVTVTDKDGNAIELGALTEDVYYTITYDPKNFTIFETYKPAGSNETVVPYGYNWCLPRHLEAVKSYDYKIDGVSHRENTIVRIVKNIEATRTEGKMVVSKTLAEIIAASKMPGSELSDKEKAVLNSGALLVDTLFLRTPDSNDKLTAVTADGNKYTLTAQSMPAGLLNDDTAAWVPVSAYPALTTGKGAAFNLTEKSAGVYEGVFTCDEQFDSVQVVYQLKITGQKAELVTELVNLADVLVSDYAQQKAALDKLCNENNFYNNLARVNQTLLGTVTGQVTLSAAGKAALKEMTDLAINPNTGNTFLYDYLTQYMSENGGMSYYYKGQNAANIQNQINLVNKNLPIIWNDPAVQKYLADMGMQSEGARVETILNQLKATDLKPVNALVNTNSPFIDNLLAVITGAGTVSSHAAVTKPIEMEQILSAAAPGQSFYGIEIQVLNKNDGVVEVFKSEAYAKVGTDISVATLRAMYENLLATIPNTEYYVADIELPETPVRLTENGKIFVGSLRPVTYTVKIDGEADQTVYAFDAYTITLPGTGDNGLKYIYSVNGSKVEVGSGALENFALGTSIEAIEALFGADRELVITRELIDVNKANLLNFIEKMNVILGNSGLSVDNKLTVALIPVTDANGNLSVVMRTTTESASLSPAVFASELTSLIEDLSYVGINGSPLFGLNSDGELKLHMQTLINMQLNGGYGLDALSAMIDSKGNINELKLIGASSKITLPNGMIIDKANELGGQMMVSTLQYGVNVNNCTSVPFYVTYQDFDTQKDTLKQVKAGADQLLPYVNVNMKDGALNTIVNAPDSAYAYMLTTLLAVGQVRFDTMQSYDLTEIMNYTFGLITPMYNDDHISADTFFNTFKKTGFYDAIAGFNVEDHKALMNFLYNGVDHVFDHVSQTGSSVGNKYSGVLHYNALNVLLDKSGERVSEFTNMIAEKDTGLDLPITFTLKNRGVEYEALVIDLHADGITNKYTLSRKATDAIAAASDDAIIILLSDVRGNVVVNSDIILNLNGYTINGDVNAKGSLTIVDSTLDTIKCGSITGKMNGHFNIGAGKYADDVTAYLEDGYYFENNVVSTGIYTLDKNGDNLDIYLGTDYLSLDKSAAKVLALDLVTKLLMNYYGCSELVVDGNTLYGVDLMDMTDSMRSPSILLNKMLDCIDCDGINAFASKFLADITDFGALANAIERDNAVVKYSLVNSAFNPYMSYLPEDDSFALNLSSAADKQRTNIRVFISDEVPVSQKAYMVKLLREMDSITEFNELAVAINEITYKNGLNFEGSVKTDVTVDLTTNGYYPVVIGAILADNAKGARRTELVDAINTYLSNKGTDALQSALDKMTIAEMMGALEHSKSKSFASILNGLGIDVPAAVELESIYTIGRKVAGTIVDYSGKTGTSHALGGLKVSGTYSTYSYGVVKSSDAYVKFSLILMAEVPTLPEEPEPPVTCEHEYNKVVTAPTCEDEGYTTYTCIHCGDSYKTDIVSALNHEGTTVTVAGYAATCTKPGLTDAIYCNACGKVIKQPVEIPVVDHTPELIPGYAATCTEPGMTDGYKCSVCGEILTAQSVIKAHHTPEVYEKAPTCTEPGIAGASKCSVCGEFVEAGTEIPALGHAAELIPGYAATCTTPGMSDGYKCSRCGEILSAGVVIPVLDHTPVLVPGYAATCTENGMTDGYNCSVCGHVIQAQTVITAHHTPEVYEKAPTCTEPGIAGASKCTVCGEMIEVGTVIPALGHTSELIPGYAATCTEPGMTDGYKCSVCGETIVDPVVIPATDHTEVLIPGYAPTCTEDGLTDGYVCSVCGATLTAQTVIPAQHIPGSYEKAPTCTEPGVTGATKCSVCGETVAAGTVVPALGHDPKAVGGSDPTCTEPGRTPDYICSRCGEVLSHGVEIPANGHRFAVADGIPADCTNTGLTVGVYCPDCDHVFVAQEIIDALGHVVVIDPAVDPSCTVSGKTEGSHCSRCGDIFVAQDIIPVNDHTVVVDPAIPATTTSTGKSEGSHCGVCGKVLVAQTELAKLPVIHVPTVSLENKDVILGGKVDADEHYIFLDSNPNGLKVKDFPYVHFEIDNETESTVTIADGRKVRKDDDLVCTGDVVTVWATNKDGVEVEVSYTIIIMGDANCDGKLNARDTALMKAAFVGEQSLEGDGYLAADMNFDGKLNARDTAACDSKFVNWNDGYNSLTK